jgi:hypothetical protein
MEHRGHAPLAQGGWAPPTGAGIPSGYHSGSGGYNPANEHQYGQFQGNAPPRTYLSATQKERSPLLMRRFVQLVRPRSSSITDRRCRVDTMDRRSSRFSSIRSVRVAKRRCV